MALFFFNLLYIKKLDVEVGQYTFLMCNMDSYG